jgi:heme A synthase
LKPQQIPAAMAILVFCQLFGGALMLNFAQLAFSNSLLTALQKYAPTVDPATVIAAGATAMRQVIPADQLGGVLKAYDVGLQHVYYLTTGCAAASLFFSLGMGWRKIATKKKTDTSNA